MALSLFPPRMNEAAERVVATATLLRSIRDSAGDMPWAWLQDLQNQLELVEIAAGRALAEGQKSPASATTYMVNMGGPATLAIFQQRLGEAKSAGVAWGSMLETWLKSKPASLVQTVERVGRGGGQDTARLVGVTMIPATAANEIRNSAELATLITAFEAVGG